MAESGRVQVVYTANVGSPLTADVAAGATVVTVDDTSDFDTDGTLQVAGETVGYTAVDDDTGVVTLAAAVTAAADAGDLVTLWDTGLDRAAVEYRAHVELPGVLDNADAVDATIRHTLIAYLEEGIRTPGTGESVRLERQGSDWVVVDVLGKQPSMAGGGSNVVTGSQDDPTGTSITATLAGAGSSVSTGSSSTDGANIAIGQYAEADGAGNIAIGDNASAQNYDPVGGAFYHSSVAIGMLASASGDDSCTAVGGHAAAGGIRATAIGFEATAYTHAVAVGEDAFCNQPNGIAIGENADVFNDSGTADSSIAIGSRTQITGKQSVAIGLAARASEDYAVNVGPCSDATKGAHGRASVAIGADAKTTTTAYQAIALGRASSAEASGAIAIGASLAMGGDAVAVGTSAQANGNNGIGLLGTANFNDSVAIGIGSAAAAASDFVLGAASHKVKIAGRLNVAQRTPTGSADTQGAVGDITSDASFVYVKTSAGWKRAALSTF